MANKEIAIEYTEDRYTSRNEMSRSIGFQISDLMWKKVTDYRANFNRTISTKWFGTKNFVLCVYPTFASKINQIETKLTRLVTDAKDLDKTNGDAKHFKLTCTKNVLNEIAKHDGFSIDENNLNKLIASENPFDKNEDKLVNYLAALKYIDERYVNNIDVDFLADLYSKVSGNEELTYFYRDKNDINVNSLSLVSRIYDSAPVEYIEVMMDSLFDFIKNGTIAVSEKALIAYAYTTLVKPFKDYNEEIGILLAKAVLAHFSYGEIVTCVNFEALINMKADEKRKINAEVQQNVDLTYALTNYTNIVETEINSVLSLLREYTVKTLKNDFYQSDVQAEKKEEIVLDVANEIKEEISEIKTEIKPEEKIEPIKPVKNEIKVSNKEEPIKHVEVSNETPKGLAVSFIPTELDEKTASRLEQHLLEMDVCLKRGEAYFYARHCSLGMNYTIDQYKKSVKCVYETARTSMEHLTELGYYSKKQVGKKFVYTPVERK